jgi:hypothetical protein
MEYDSPIGMIHVGTTPWGSWGTAFGDSGSRQNAIKYFPPVPAPFTAVVFTGKLTDADSSDTVSAVLNTTGDVTDQDRDYYEARFGYKTDAIETQFGLGLDDNQTTPATAINKWRFRGFAKTKLAGLNVEGEFDHTFGDTETAGVTTDYDAWAAYAHVSGKVNTLALGLLGWYCSGDTTPAAGAGNGDLEAYGTGGTDWEPLLIATGDDYGLLNPDLGTAAGYYGAVVANAGQVAVGAYASMPVSDKLTLTTVVGSAWADETTQIGANVDDHYGYEIDLKADYKLLDNLTYSVNFGYFATGDLFDDVLGTTVEDSVTLVNHTLNMSF